MTARLFALAGIDLRQWRALVVAGIRLDFRTPGIVEGGSAGIRRLLALGAMNLVLGLGLGAIALFVPDLFVSGSLVLTLTMFLVALSIVMEFAVVVISPIDHDVLAHHPISGPTFLAARVTNVLFYTAVITTTLAALPMAAFFFARGFNVWIGLAGVLATYLGCLTTTLAMVALYVATARVVPPQRLRRVLTYVQLVTSFSLYGAYFLLPEIFRPRVLSGWTVNKEWWMLLYPPTWFASYLELAAGRWSPLEVLPALASVAALAALMVIVAGWLSLDYSETIARQVAHGGRQAAAGRSWMPGSRWSGERRAVALLIRAQFRHDQRFRLGIFAVVPLSIFYLLLALRDGELADPFVQYQWGHGGMLLYFAAVFIPMVLLMAVGRSDAYRAAWIFHVTPARPARLVLAAKDFTVACLLTPYLLVLAVVLSYFFGNAWHGFVHVFIQGLIANLMLLLLVALQPNLPFSQPVQKGQFTAGYVLVALAGGIAQPLSSVLLSNFVYPHPSAVVAVVVLLVGAAIGVRKWLERRLEHVAATMEVVA